MTNAPETTEEVTSNELVVVDPKEFGLDEKSGKEVESVFAPLIAEREALTSAYEAILAKEITPEIVKEAYQLRLRLVKVRTGTDKVHKTAKAFYLAGGKFVDAWKNKNNSAVELMESKLTEIETYYEKIEAQKISDLQKQRESELLAYEVENVETLRLGEMSEQVWGNFLTGSKVNYESKKEAERLAEAARIEAERKEQLRRKRELEIAPYMQFVGEVSYQLGEETEEEFEAIMAKLRGAKAAYIEEQEKMKAEKERLEKELAEQKALAEAEAKRAAAEAARIKAENDKKAAEEKARVDAEQEKMRKEAQAKIDAERKERERLQAELKEKEEQAAKLKAEQEAAAEAELSKGDAEKFADFIIQLKHITTRYQFKSKSYQKLYVSAIELITKTVTYLEGKMPK